MSVSSIIDVWKMEEIKPLTRARILITLGGAINHQYASNMTEELIYELLCELGVRSLNDESVNNYMEIAEKYYVKKPKQEG